jgi:mono/diheme cytochrome c family protein
LADWVDGKTLDAPKAVEYAPGEGPMRIQFAILSALSVVVLADCLTPIEAQQPSASAPTYTKDVAPILFKQCASCHRPGEAAPMSLLTYEQTRPYAKAIANAVSRGTMPPWHAEAPIGTFHNERILSDAERRTLIDWASGDAPRGIASDTPAPPAFVEGWSLGTPDLVLSMDEDFAIPASGTIEYEHFYIPTNFTDEKWITSMEVKPGNRQLVHHVLVYYVAKTDAPSTAWARANEKDMMTPRPRTQGQRARRSAEGITRKLVATYAPGTNPQQAPAGTAFRLEAGGTIELQMHYTTNGKPSTDRTRVGLTFAKAATPREVRAQSFHNGQLKLPAGAADVAVSTDLEFLQDSVVWALFPHTHLRGKRWEYKLQLPNGDIRPILSVPRYDFNWQTYYMFTEPVRAPKGSKIVSTAWYDNSAANKSNPDPTKDVLWGDQTWEEMQYSGVLLSLSN